MLDNYSLSQIQQLGIAIFSEGPDSTISDLNFYFPEADFHSLACQLTEAIKPIGYSWESQWLVMAYTTDFSIIEMNYEGRGAHGPLLLLHSLSNDASGTTANLNSIEVPIPIRRQNISRILYGTFFNHYASLGVKRMALHAGLTAGGYVWARAGFAAVNKSEVEEVLRHAQEILDTVEGCVITLEYLEIMQLLFELHYDTSPDQPFPIHEWAIDRNLGREILVETQWDGVLDLDNVSQVAIFNTYLTTRP